jgi:hypothetical protein
LKRIFENKSNIAKGERIQKIHEMMIMLLLALLLLLLESLLLLAFASLLLLASFLFPAPPRCCQLQCFSSVPHVYTYLVLLASWFCWRFLSASYALLLALCRRWHSWGCWCKSTHVNSVTAVAGFC